MIEFVGGPLDGTESEIILDPSDPYMVFELALSGRSVDLYALYKYEDGVLKFIRTKSKAQLLGTAGES